MSDNDKQLTVAELLARAGKDNPDGGERPRRRRRRSLEEGGISVAELTGSFRKVDARPEEAKHSSVPIDEPKPAQEEKPEKTEEPVKAEEPAKADKPDETTVIKKVDDAAVDEAVVDEAPAAKPAAPEKSAERAERAEPAEPAAPEKPSAQDMDETGVMPAVEDEDLADEGVQGSSVVVDEDVDADYDDDYYDEDEEDYDGDLNIPALVGMILGGLVLGVAVFLGFEWLWANLNAFLVAVLAVVVTVVMVGVVKALRTQKDGLMMTLAGIVGVLMTFGPGLVTLL